MQALVLGGNGFIGSHLVDHLLLGGNRVRVFSRNLNHLELSRVNLEYFSGDFSDIHTLARALEDIDIVFHLISTTVPATSNLDPVADISGNLVNTVKLLELMVQKKVARIVYLSSGGTIYGTPEYSPIQETHPMRPISSYGVVKLAIEKYLHMYSVIHGVEYVALRASNPYGPRQGKTGLQGVIGTYIKHLKEGLPIEIWGTGEIVRDFIYVDDLARLCVIAGRTSVVGSYNAGIGKGATILEIVDIISECTGITIKPVFKPGRTFDVPHAVLDNKAAVDAFNWYPKVSLKEGIALTLEYFMANEVEDGSLQKEIA